jgi:hypothetical protein
MRARKTRLAAAQSSQPPTTNDQRTSIDAQPFSTKTQPEKQPEKQGKQQSPGASGLVSTAAPDQNGASKSENVQGSEAIKISDLLNHALSSGVKTEPSVQKRAGGPKEGTSPGTKPSDASPASPALDQYISAPPQGTSGPKISDYFGQKAEAQQSSTAPVAGNRPSYPAWIQPPPTGQPVDFTMTGQGQTPQFTWGRNTVPVDDKDILAPNADILGPSKGTAPKPSTSKSGSQNPFLPRHPSGNQPTQSSLSSNPFVQGPAPPSSSFSFGLGADNTFGAQPTPIPGSVFGSQPPSTTFGVPQPNTQPHSQSPVHSDFVAPEATAPGLFRNRPNAGLPSGKNDARTDQARGRGRTGYESDTSMRSDLSSESSGAWNPYDEEEHEKEEKTDKQQRMVERKKNKLNDERAERIRKQRGGLAGRTRSEESVNYDPTFVGDESWKQSNYTSYLGGDSYLQPGESGSYAGGSGYGLLGGGGGYASGESAGQPFHLPFRPSNPAYLDERLRPKKSSGSDSPQDWEYVYSRDNPRAQHSAPGYQTQGFVDSSQLDPDGPPQPFTAAIPPDAYTDHRWWDNSTIPQGQPETGGGGMEVDEPAPDAGGNGGSYMSANYLEERDPPDAGGEVVGVGEPVSLEELLEGFNEEPGDEEMSRGDDTADVQSVQQQVELPEELSQDFDVWDELFDSPKRGSIREELDSEDGDQRPTNLDQKW